MKKLTFALLLVAFSASVANAAPSYLARDGKNAYNVTYNYTDKPKNDWYATLRAELSFLGWTNKYSITNPDPNFVYEDKYSMESVFGGSLAVGKKFGYHWRGEIEAGYTGNFTDKDNASEFTLSAPYLLVNAMYDFTSGLYVGGGLGIALPMVTMDHPFFVPGGRSETGISPMAGLMVGYTHKLDDNFVLDLRYRLAGLNGTSISREVDDGSGDVYETKVGLILDNSVSVAIRYEF